MEAVKVSFDLTNERIKNRVREAVHAAATQLKQEALSNLSPHAITGNLAKNIIDVGRDTGMGIYWKIGTAPDGFYGRFLEKGVNGPVDVREYRRATKSKGEMNVLGTVAKKERESGPLELRPWVNPKTGKQQRARRRMIVTGKTFKVLKTYAGGFTTVKAHVRHRKTAAKPWLSPALEAAAPGLRAALQAIADSPEE
jgi:hypothetical protein